MEDAGERQKLNDDGDDVIVAESDHLDSYRLKEEKKAEWDSMKISSFTFCGLVTTAYVVFICFLGIYAYGNPDPPHSYYIEGLETPGLTKNTVRKLAFERGIKIKDGYPVDMGQLFRAWFTWGFWGSIFQVAIFAVFIPMLILMKKKHQFFTRVTGALLCTLSCCNAMIWITLGFFWRYTKAGMIVTGDKLERPVDATAQEWREALKNARDSDGYQIASGRYMSTFLWIALTGFLFFALILLAIAVICCVAAIDKEDPDG